MYYIDLPQTKIGPFKTYTQAKNWLKKNPLKGTPPIEQLLDPTYWSEHVYANGTNSEAVTQAPPSEPQPSKKG